MEESQVSEFKVGDKVEVHLEGAWVSGVIANAFLVWLSDGRGDRWQEWQYHVKVGQYEYSSQPLQLRHGVWPNARAERSAADGEKT